MNLEYETFHVNNGNEEILRNKILKYKLTNTSIPLKRLVIKDSQPAISTMCLVTKDRIYRVHLVEM